MEDSNQNPNRLKALALIVVAVVIVWAAIGFIQSLRFHIVSISPNARQVSTALPLFEVNFNKTLSKNGIKLRSSPSIISAYKLNGKTLVIDLATLAANQTYVIDLQSISTTGNQTILNKKIEFEAEVISPSDLPKDEQQVILNNQANYSSPGNDPIVSHLPHSTLDYDLSSEVTTGPKGEPLLVLQAQLLLAPGVSGDAATADVSQYKQEVVNYIKSLGLNPSKYSIEYQIVNETLNGP